MEQRGPSFTAIGGGVLRAAHQILDDDPKILSDPIALRMVEGVGHDHFTMIRGQQSATTGADSPKSNRQEILDAANGFRQPLWACLRSILVMRSRFTEDCLTEAAAAGVRQYVILGAGLDSFPYRQPGWAAPLRIFEVDHPATQQWKRAQLATVGIPTPVNLNFCAIDFNSTSLAEGIDATSFKRDVPTFFSWLGVTPYLTGAAIESILCFVLSFPPPSEIVFTFMPPVHRLDQADRKVLDFILPQIAAQGEFSVTRFEADELISWLKNLGFSRVFHLSPELAEQRYFAGRRDLRVSRIDQPIKATV